MTDKTMRNGNTKRTKVSNYRNILSFSSKKKKKKLTHCPNSKILSTRRKNRGKNDNPNPHSWPLNSPGLVQVLNKIG